MSENSFSSREVVGGLGKMFGGKKCAKMLMGREHAEERRAEDTEEKKGAEELLQTGTGGI